MPQYKVALARPTYRGHERREVGTWFARTMIKCKSDPRISEVYAFDEDDTPAPMVRNAILKRAMDMKLDYVCMIDDDMDPDVERPGAKPFWDSSFDFVTGPHAGRPCMVAAPYCGCPPIECVMVFKWTNKQSDHPNLDWSLQMISREESAQRAGFEQVPCIGTGLCLISVDAYKDLPDSALPWFKYEYTDKYETHKASTEDVYFSRNLSLCGVPVYCNWDAWSYHWKPKRVGPPKTLTSDMICDGYKKAILEGQASDRKLVFVGEGKLNGQVQHAFEPARRPV